MGGCGASKPQRTHDAAKEPVVVFEADTSAQPVQARPRSPALRHASTNKVGVSDDEPKHAVSSAAVAQQGSSVEAEVLVHAGETELFLMHRGLTVTPNLKGCSLLVKLHLRGNQLTVTPDLTDCPLLKDLDLSFNLLTVAPDLTGCPQLKELKLYNNRLTVPPNLKGCSLLVNLNLYNNLLKTFPDIAHLRALKSLSLANNALDGPLPDIKFPATITYLTLNNNPLLHGAILKSLVAQCTTGLRHSGCRQWSDCTPEQQKQGLYLQTPFFVGVTVASQDIEAFILFRIKSLGITLDMMLDAPAKGDPKSAMVKEKGDDWIPWQEQWLNGLLALKSGSKIFAILTEEHFKVKYINESQCDSPAKCAALNFDPEWGLVKGERATSILDWEARQFARVSELHGLKVCKFVDGLGRGVDGWGRDGESNDSDTSWHPVPHEVQRRFD